MDFSVFGRFIVAMGLVVMLYGGSRYLLNPDEVFDPAKSGQTVFGGRDDVGNMLGVSMRNAAREQIRAGVPKIRMGGGVLAFIGIGMVVSASTAARRLED